MDLVDAYLALLQVHGQFAEDLEKIKQEQGKCDDILASEQFEKELGLGL